MGLRRPSVAAAIVALGALVFAGSAQACSCARVAPVAAMQRADAAVVAKLVRVVPRSRLVADYRYRVQRVYKRGGGIRRGRVISVRSARGAAACGLPRRQRRAIGLFLRRDRRRHWTAGICSTIAPPRLARAARRDRARGPAAQASCAG